MMLFNPLFAFLQVLPAAIANDLTDEAAFSQSDPYGFMMAIIGMGIVFSALFLMYLIFSNTPRLYTASFKNNLRRIFRKRHHHQAEATAQPGMLATQDLTGEVNAAIAAAIHLYRSELHDYEDTVLTIKKVSRTYSPWSSKIYGLRNRHI